MTSVAKNSVCLSLFLQSLFSYLLGKIHNLIEKNTKNLASYKKVNGFKSMF